ncbi:MAG: response regulator [Acidobacteria bacterium]|nr:response regulator [Acidobacteriota bacterium]
MARTSAAGEEDPIRPAAGKDAGAALSRAGFLLGLAVALVGAWHLAAWVAGGEKAWSGFSVITTKANAALCLFLLGTALALGTRGDTRRARLRHLLAAACALCAAVVGGLTVYEYLAGVDLGIDQLIVPQPEGALGGVAPNRMGLPVALGALFGGPAVLAFVRRPALAVAGQVLGLGVVLLGLLSTIGYAYGVEALYGIAGVTAIAWPAALSLLATGLGLLFARPSDGLMAVVTADDAGGHLLRRLLPPTLAVPFLIGWLRLLGERGEWYETSAGTGLLILFFIVAFTVLLFAGARQVNRWGAALTETERDRERLVATLAADRGRLREINERLRGTFDLAAAGIAQIDLGTGRFVRVNRQFSIMTAYSAELLQDMTLVDVTHPGQRPQVREALARARSGEITGPYRMEPRYVCGDGRVIDVELHGSVVKDAADRPVEAMIVVIDVSARKAAERELAEARQAAERARVAAEEASLAKDHFLSVLSHELRTPLTPVLTGVALLQREALPAGAKRLLEVIQRNVELESRLIDDLLDLTRITRGKIELDKRPVELCTVVDRAVEVCQADMHARQLHFAVDYGPGPYLVEADAARLQQVFWNLLKNAIKFTPAGGCIGLRCRPEDGQVLVEVTDSGMGIEASSLGGIFDAFAQGGRSITRQFGGLGLGLTISRALVELHGGQIEARSEGRDRGATFAVRLPAVSIGAGLSTAAAGSEGATAAAPVRPLHILLVEDHGDTADLLATVLELEGHSVELAGDVAAALEALGRGLFDLLVSDLGLPDRTGLELIRELRDRGARLPAIALSGYGQERDIERSREAGFAEHLVKPVEPRAVLEAIARVMRQ